MVDLNKSTWQFWEDYDEDGDYMIHRLVIKYPGQRYFTTINVTNMTELEVEAMREFFNMVVERALPGVRKLDAQAAEALERGDDVYARSYRAVPEIIRRERKQSAHGQGVPSRPDWPGEVDRRASVAGPSATDNIATDESVPDPAPGPVESPNDEAEGERL
jgi:hypothetical protein